MTDKNDESVEIGKEIMIFLAGLATKHELPVGQMERSTMGCLLTLSIAGTNKTPEEAIEYMDKQWLWVKKYAEETLVKND